MSTPYLGEIRMFAGNFAPSGWLFCDGQTVAIADYDALYNLIGTTYGGDGVETFALPDLRGRIPFHVSNSHVLGEMGGVENVTLTTQQIPQHTHPFPCNASTSNTSRPSGNAVGGGYLAFADPSSVNGTMNSGMMTSVGGSQPHDNMAPYLGINFIIAMEGIFPSQT